MTALPQVFTLQEIKKMADQNKFEQMLEKLVNEDKAGAEELFHEIVVEKSRDIYESLLESDLDDEAVDEATDEEVDESDDTEIEEGGHSDQMIKDKENMSKAEFEKKYGDAAKDMDESAKSASETMREYVEKVSATMGDNGANNTSAVAKPNNMGGTAGNLNQAGSDASSETGAGKKIAGSALNDQNAKDIGTGNVNVPGGKAAKAGKTVPAGHGAEKKGAGETADKAAGSTLNKVSSRAK